MTLTTVAVTLMVVLLMLSLGLELRLQDLVAGASRRGAFIGGLALNLLALPLLVLAFGETGAVSADVIVGLLIIAVAPGGPVGAGMARLSAADLGFSVALLTALGVLSVVTAPLAVVFGLSGTALLVPMLTTLVLCQLAPLTLGMAARRAGQSGRRRRRGRCVRRRRRCCCSSWWAWSGSTWGGCWPRPWGSTSPS
ncbi:MAG: bile acid:sodium symporter [Deltaproteobacteria bacterium]|nr:bile acid:sodium symporter [Deltaproteobacteria bacterium]